MEIALALEKLQIAILVKRIVFILRPDSTDRVEIYSKVRPETDLDQTPTSMINRLITLQPTRSNLPASASESLTKLQSGSNQKSMDSHSQLIDDNRTSFVALTMRATDLKVTLLLSVRRLHT